MTALPVWLTLALYVLGTVGFVQVMTQGKITSRVRQWWPGLLGCPMCFGVWAGAGLAAWVFSSAFVPAWVNAIAQGVALAFCVSLAADTVAIVHHKLMAGGNDGS